MKLSELRKLNDDFVNNTRRGISPADARKADGVGSGAWRMAGRRLMHMAFPNDFFQHNKLYSLLEMK